MKSLLTILALCAGVVILVSFSQQDRLKASMERGKKIYEGTCLPCHQANGSGVPGMNPPLVKSPYVVGGKDTLVGIVVNGLEQDVVIKGKTYSNPMPAQPQLKDKEIADVLTYVRNSFGNRASAVTANEVKKFRVK